MWAIRRRLYILIIVIAVALSAIVLPPLVYNWLKPAMCNDALKNGTETGVDCGGNCPRLCFDVQKPLEVEWSRIIHVDDNVYSLAFSVENQNFESFAYNVAYQCTIVDAEYSKLKTVSGTISIPPAGRYVVTDNSLEIPQGKPDKILCALANHYVYLPLPHDSIPNPFLITKVLLETETTRPRAKATVATNDQKRLFHFVDFVASVYDSNDSLVAVSKTRVPRLKAGKDYDLVYTWPNPFIGDAPFRVEITPLFSFPEYDALLQK